MALSNSSPMPAWPARRWMKTAATAKFVGTFLLSSSHRVWQTRHLTRVPAAHRYMRQRSPAKLSRHGAWRYCRYCLSGVELEELLAAPGVRLRSRRDPRHLIPLDIHALHIGEVVVL